MVVTWWIVAFLRSALSPAKINHCFRRPLIFQHFSFHSVPVTLGGQRQHGMTSLSDTFTNVPQWELDPAPTIDPSSIASSTIPCASVPNESMEECVLSSDGQYTYVEASMA